MIELNEAQLKMINGGKFRWHINPFHIVFAAVGGFLTGGPVGAGIMIGAAIAAQGSGQLGEMAKDHANANPYQEMTLGR